MFSEIEEQKRITHEKQYLYQKKGRTEHRERYNALVGIRIERAYENTDGYTEKVKLKAK